MQTLAADQEPAAAVEAVARLVEIDTRLVLPVLPAVLASPNGDVRGYGVEVLYRHPSEAHVKRLGDRLVDPHPEVPRHVLVAPNGRILVYLQEQPGIPLDKFVGQAMGVDGERHRHPELTPPMIVVERLTPAQRDAVRSFFDFQILERRLRWSAKRAIAFLDAGSKA